MTHLEFNNLVADSTTSLKPFAVKLTRNPDDADDLIQETVVRAISNHEKFNEGTNLKAWLYTIMRNIFINNYRRNMKRNTMIDTTDNQYFINSHAPAIKNDAISGFVMSDLEKAVDSLSDEFRIPFIMHYEGYKYNEISEHLKLPLGTVKSRIFFARKELKSYLKNLRYESQDDKLMDLAE
jgi:RNA polymerase sigma-70 factor, ECF subfamily